MGGFKGKTFAKIDDVIAEIEQMKKAPEKVVKRTVADFKKRAPSWVAQEVVKHYNIKKAEITPAKTEGAAKAAGTVKVEGKTLDGVQLIYRGRVLTPTHFGMTPKAPKQSYTLKAQVKKGEKKTLGQVKKLTKKQRKNIGKNFTQQGTRNSPKSPIMLMGTGNTKVDGTNYIPFQRQSQNRKDIKAIKTVSMPQMVSNPQVDEDIRKAINDKLGKRFNHYCEQYLGGDK